MIIEVVAENDMRRLGAAVAGLFKGGELIELIGDVGAGKTTFTKGIGKGLAIEDDIQSPSFTISRTYDARDNLRLVHYDFYRLHDAGIMSHDLEESINDMNTVTVIEWAEIVQGVLPEERLTIQITSPTETMRELHFSARGEQYENILKELV